MTLNSGDRAYMFVKNTCTVYIKQHCHYIVVDIVREVPTRTRSMRLETSDIPCSVGVDNNADMHSCTMLSLSSLSATEIKHKHK